MKRELMGVPFSFAINLYNKIYIHSAEKQEVLITLKHFVAARIGVIEVWRSDGIAATVPDCYRVSN